MKNTVATFRQAKGREKLVMLTAYDYSTAKLMDRTGVNALLVGDSLGMVMLGYPDTLSVTLEDMIRHCAAVARGACSALVVCDMPFMSCQVSVTDTGWSRKAGPRPSSWKAARTSATRCAGSRGRPSRLWAIWA
jgi:3-methyl-2-oxobutanoate hydroxymethyltransferase